MIEIRLVKRNKSGQAICLFECDCGKLFEAQRYKVTSGHTKSCGCYKIKKLIARSTKHGHSLNDNNMTPTYVSWARMKSRCLNPNSNRYHRYGGRGIRVHDDWLSFAGFLASMGERPSLDYSIGRVDPDGHYEPGNCRWILKSENSSRRFK